jgi:hypothetical protein
MLLLQQQLQLRYYVGIAGTAVLIIMWVVTRIPGNPITGGEGQVSEIGVAIEILQVAFIVLTAAILSKERKKESRPTAKHNKPAT